MKTNQSMNMIGHDHKTHAHPLLIGQLDRKKMDHDALGLVIIQQSAPLIARKRHEMPMTGDIKDLATHDGAYSFT